VSRGDLTDAQWRILDPLLPDRGERGPARADKRRPLGRQALSTFQPNEFRNYFRNAGYAPT